MNVVRLNFNKSGEVYDNDIDPEAYKEGKYWYKLSKWTLEDWLDTMA